MDLNRNHQWIMVVCVALLLVSGGVLSGCNVASVEEGVAAEQVPPPAPVVEDSTTQVLRQRATEFGDLLQRLRHLTREEAYYELQFYIEPSPDLRDRVVEYFRDFSVNLKTATIRTQRVTTINMHRNGQMAQVTYEIDFDMAFVDAVGKDAVPTVQVTTWKQVDGEWYRTLDDPTKSLR